MSCSVYSIWSGDVVSQRPATRRRHLHSQCISRSAQSSHVDPTTKCRQQCACCCVDVGTSVRPFVCPSRACRHIATHAAVGKLFYDTGELFRVKRGERATWSRATLTPAGELARLTLRAPCSQRRFTVHTTFWERHTDTMWTKQHAALRKLISKSTALNHTENKSTAVARIKLVHVHVTYN